MSYHLDYRPLRGLLCNKLIQKWTRTTLGGEREHLHRKQAYSDVLQIAWKSNFRERVKYFQPAGTRRNSLTRKSPHRQSVDPIWSPHFHRADVRNALFKRLKCTELRCLWQFLVWWLWGTRIFLIHYSGWGRVHGKKVSFKDSFISTFTFRAVWLYMQ